MITSKLKKFEIRKMDLSPRGARISCEICGCNKVASAFHTKAFQPVIFTLERASLRDLRFTKSICRDCLTFWNVKALPPNQKSDSRWEECEQMVLRFFSSRGIPSTRTLRTGTDVFAQIFGTVFRIEVKSAINEGPFITARGVTPRRLKDDLVALVTPENRIYWLAMPWYLKRTSPAGFAERKEVLQRHYSSHHFESAVLPIAQEKGMPLGEFCLCEPSRRIAVNSKTILRRRK